MSASMTPETNLASLSATEVHPIAGAAITAAALFVLHRRRIKTDHIQENIDEPIDLYSAVATLNTAIVRASRRKS